MSIEHRDPEPVSRVEVEKMVNGPLATAAQVAVQNARRAADHAVMAIFELAFLLQSLDDTIGRYNAETERPLEGRP
ncbi:MAG TPA: hypothetical protein VGH98_08570 [Gemmatimonadaceae bacterium]|jgi:hypothetical protein